MLKKLTEMLKSFLGKVEVTEEEIAKSAEPTADRAEAIEKAMKSLSEFEATLPEDAADAVKVLAKYSVLAPEAEVTIEKVGARLSKATLTELKKIKSAIDKLLVDMIESEEDGATPPEEEPKEKWPPEVAAKLKKLREYEAKESAALRKAEEKEKTDLKDQIKTLSERLEKIEKTKGVTKAIKDQDGDEDPKDADKTKKVDKAGTFQWTSLLSAQPEE